MTKGRCALAVLAVLVALSGCAAGGGRTVPVRYATGGINPRTVCVDRALIPQVGDQFIPDPETGNGHRVHSREVHLDHVLVFLER